MMSKIDEIFRMVLNDREIFWIKKEIFNKKEWNDLKKTINQVKEFNERINQKIRSLEDEERKISDNGIRNDIKMAKRLCSNLLASSEQKPHILNQMFDFLDSFGVVECNLPNMDDYGKVIERYSISIVEQFFLDKMKRENNKHRKRALAKVLEYVKELYNANISVEEIAYFVRKLDSLRILWEV